MKIFDKKILSITVKLFKVYASFQNFKIFDKKIRQISKNLQNLKIFDMIFDKKMLIFSHTVYEGSYDGGE